MILNETFFREEMGSVIPALEGAPRSCDHNARSSRVFDYAPGQSSAIHCADFTAGRLVSTTVTDR